MKTMISGVLAWLLFVALPINAFLPNRLSAIDVGRDTLTHEDITQIGILKAVAYYFEDNPKPGNPLSPGTLVDMSDISAVKLFKVYYGAEVNANGLQEVISSISTHNSQTYADLMSNAVWHMNGELIKEGDPDVFKTGKCSHGGRFDSTSKTVAATGGINKDSTVESLSPQTYLHHQAAQAAINHTTFFFNDKVYGLRHLIDKNKFERFLQTRSGVSLVFVVDSTGSMSDDIAAVKGQIVEIIFKHLGTPREPSNYVIVLFNDPANLTTSFQTKSNQEALNYVNEINVDGGGDCPEYSMTGIETGLQYIGHQRSRRSLTGIDLYKNLASSTGGSVYQTTKAGIAKLANIITEISITSPVTILKREVQPGSRDIDIQVDSTITQLTLDITGTGSLNEKIYNPAANHHD